MKKTTAIRCPYCNNVQNYDIEDGFSTLLCYPEDGGCDEYFTVQIYFTPAITTFKLVKSDTQKARDW